MAGRDEVDAVVAVEVLAVQADWKRGDKNVIPVGGFLGWADVCHATIQNMCVCASKCPCICLSTYEFCLKNEALKRRTLFAVCGRRDRIECSANCLALCADYVLKHI